MRRGALGGLLGLVFVVGSGCGGSSKAQLTHPVKDAYGKLAAAAAERPCGQVDAAGPIPTAPAKRADSDFEYDVVFYLAHPEDETLFTPGTMEALVRAKKRTYEVVLSHGEGGRLLERDATGRVSEKAGVPPDKVAEVRDKELARVMKTLGLEYEHLYPASAGSDFAAADVQGRERAIHSCVDTLEKWDEILHEGVAGLLKKLVASIRMKRPRVIVTHDARDDDDWLDHGHHKALGALVEIAARAAADPRYAGVPPHVVEEVITIAPKQVPADLTLAVGNEMRKKLVAANTSQFEPAKFAEVAQRTDERYVVRWRAKGVDKVEGGSLLGLFAKPPK
jgi:LmbE family N-acetylglucosaminyl deacetylase